MIEESFQTRIEDAILGRLVEAMGPGGVYEEPPYLQIQSTPRAAGQPVPQIPEDETPAVWLEHIAGTAQDRSVGTAMPFGLETFGLFGQLVFTPEGVGYMGRDPQEFARFTEASKDTFYRRIRYLLLGWSPKVACPVTGEKATQLRVDLWAGPTTRIGEFKLAYNIIMRCQVQTEP